MKDNLGRRPAGLPLLGRGSALPLSVMAILAAIVASCASIGNPGGGPRDEDPPRYVRSSPAMGAVDFNGDKVDIWFSELVNLKDAFSKVVVSPPGSKTPRVSSQGNRVTVSFADTLRPNTTYTIDFGNAIEDNNESNPLENFSFVFSTGPQIDSLRISGMVLNSENLEPLQGKLVGIHSVLADSAFRTLRFDRVARTDDRGRFCIFGVAPGAYRVFAIDDADADFRYSSPEEEIAFYDVTVNPFTRAGMASDTIFNLLTGEMDTVMQRARTIYLPNDILLRSFKSAARQQYMSKYERIDTTRLSFQFNSPAEGLPEFGVVGAPRIKDWYVPESSAGKDSITLWLRPRSLVSADTLRISATYLRSDSALNLKSFTDTLRFTFDRRKHERIQEKALKDYIKKMRQGHDDTTVYTLPPVYLTLNMLTSATHEVYQPLVFETSTPIERMDTSMLRLEYKRDTTWVRLPDLKISQPDSLRPRTFRIEHAWEYDTQYRLVADSAAMTGLYGAHNREFTHQFTTRAEKDYSALRLILHGLDPEVPAFVQVLQSDNPIRSAVVKDGVAEFRHLLPGKYYLRVYEDFNGNGKYDPGDYDAGIQPDMAYYYPKAVTLKKNWDKEQVWDVFATAIDLQKPDAIRKLRPAQRKGAAVKPPEEPEEEE